MRVQHVFLQYFDTIGWVTGGVSSQLSHALKKSQKFTVSG